jgi:hypothetical protein
MSSIDRERDLWSGGPTIELTCYNTIKSSRDDILSYLLSLHLVTFEDEKTWLSRLEARRVGLVINSMEDGSIVWLGVPPGFVCHEVCPADVLQRCKTACVGQVEVAIALVEIGLRLLQDHKVDRCVVASETDTHPDRESFQGGVAVSVASMLPKLPGYADGETVGPCGWVTVRSCDGPWGSQNRAR